MITTRRFKTNLRCGGCVAAVKPHLDRAPGVARWEVDIASPDKTLTVDGDAPAEAVKAAVAHGGYQVLGEIETPPPPAVESQPPAPVAATTYYPLFLLSAFLVGVAALAEVRTGGFDWGRAMGNFMGAFFLAFSFFKLLDLRGFADAYRSYDVVARRVPAYGYAYPFIELSLGAAYLTGFQPVATNLATLVVMSVSAVGVLRSLLAKRKIRCACLGTVFNLPMSTVTLVEDALMVVMAAVMLFTGPHGSHAIADEPISLSQIGVGLMHHHGTHHGHGQGHHEPNAGASLLVQADSIRQAGQPSTLRLMIHDANGALVKDFDALHEQKVHLIIVREGLDTFAHVHPQVDAAGNLVVPYTFPVGGTYRLYADFQPAGGAPATASALVQVRGDAPAAVALKANVPGRVRGDGLTADVAVKNAGPGGEAMVRFELFDANGRPVQDLQPYLGEWGHLNLIGSDGREYVHAHPQNRGPGDAANVVVFHAGFRNGGLYKGWGQFLRGDAVHVVPFIIDVR
jgi:copper chaperone CopZ